MRYYLLFLLFQARRTHSFGTSSLFGNNPPVSSRAAAAVVYLVATDRTHRSVKLCWIDDGSIENNNDEDGRNADPIRTSFVLRNSMHSAALAAINSRPAYSSQDGFDDVFDDDDDDDDNIGYDTALFFLW